MKITDKVTTKSIFFTIFCEKYSLELVLKNASKSLFDSKTFIEVCIPNLRVKCEDSCLYMKAGAYGANKDQALQNLINKISMENLSISSKSNFTVDIFINPIEIINDLKLNEL